MASALKEKLSSSIKIFMKSGEKDKLLYARSLHALIRKKEIDDKIELGDEGVIQLVQSSLKQRRDSLEQFRKASRMDLVVKEEAEAQFLMEFLPKQLDEAEIASLIDQALQETGAKAQKDIGMLMKALMPKLQGRADGKKVQEIVKQKLI